MFDARILSRVFNCALVGTSPINPAQKPRYLTQRTIQDSMKKTAREISHTETTSRESRHLTQRTKQDITEQTAREISHTEDKARHHRTDGQGDLTHR